MEGEGGTLIPHHRSMQTIKDALNPHSFCQMMFRLFHPLALSLF